MRIVKILKPEDKNVWKTKNYYTLNRELTSDRGHVSNGSGPCNLYQMSEFSKSKSRFYCYKISTICELFESHFYKDTADYQRG